MTNQELYQEENRQLLKSIAKGISDFKEVLQGQIDITVNQPDEMTVNTEKSVEVTNLEQMKEWVDDLGVVVTKAIEDNSYKPVNEVSIKNVKDILPSKLTISNLSDIKTYFSEVTRAIEKNQPIVNITKQDIVFPRSAKDAIPVRLSDGKGFYNAIATAISSGNNGQAHLHIGGNPVTSANPIPVDIQDASVTINGDVTVSSEVEVKNDSGNPVPVSGTVTATPTGTQNVDITANTIGIATSAKQDLLLTELQLKADLTETQPVSLASVPTHAVTNAGTFATQAAQSGTWNIGTVTTLTGITNNVNTVEVAPTTILNGNKNVTTAGTRVTLASSTSCKSVTIKAKVANTGTIYVGDTSVSSSNGFALAAGETVSLDIANLNTVNLDASVSGEGVTYVGVN